MTRAADRIFENAEVHSLGESDEIHDAVAVRDGRIVRVGSDYEVEFLRGVDTDVVDCEGNVLLPGFIDAHTHLEILGRRLVRADLDTGARTAALDRLHEAADGDDEWVLGYGYDESNWADDRLLQRTELDSVSTDRPVVAFREDLHTASANSVVFERYGDELPEAGVERTDGEPTGVVREAAAERLRRETAPDRAETRRLVTAARDDAHERGVTGVHEMVRASEAPAVYRTLARDGELGLRVRLYYWADHLDAVEETGLVANCGSDFVEIGGIKAYADGSLGARTARLSEPYADGDGRGEWLTDPERLGELAARVDDLGLQFAVHAIGDEAVEAVLSALPDDSNRRHRIEHAELLPGAAADFDAVASMQPNFLRWARADGLYAARLGAERAATVDRFADLLAAGVPVAFGSDCMPLDPLYGVEQAVTAPEDSQRLTVTEALCAYTTGAAYAGHDEDRLGTIEVGKRADLVLLEESPWAVDDDAIADIDVTMTVVDGDVVYRA